MYRNTWMEVNLDAIADNVRRIHDICGKRIIAVLKADAYGCGDNHVAKAVLEAGAEMIAVSSLDEAFMLRNEGYDGEILILGATDPEDASRMIEADISPAAYSMEWVRSVIEHKPAGLKVHLKVDTGMNRIGFKDIPSLQEAFSLLSENGCKMEGIFTHFYCADSSKELTQKQFDRFAAAVKALDYPFPWIHCDNSDATVFFKDDLSNACRLGVSMYGVSSYLNDLRHPIAMFSQVVMTKQVKAGETIGYGALYTAEKDEIIATIPIGYADGFIRANKGRCVWIAGQFAPVCGNVCMDQIMVRLEKDVPIGTPVEIFGPHIHLEKMAEELHTIPYEIICLISGRVTRTYIWHGKNLTEENARIIKSEVNSL